MNERIKELLVQAMTEVGPDDTDLKTLEKFAELIVRECANFITEYYPHSRYEAFCMKQHFGVKE